MIDELKKRVADGEITLAELVDLLTYLNSIVGGLLGVSKPPVGVRCTNSNNYSVKLSTATNAVTGKAYTGDTLAILELCMEMEGVCGFFASKKQWWTLGRNVKDGATESSTVVIPYKKDKFAYLYAYEQTEAV